MKRIFYVQLPKSIKRMVFDDCIYLNSLYYDRPEEEVEIKEADNNAKRV